MNKPYFVSFEYSHGVYCTNLVYAYSQTALEIAYSNKYKVLSVSEAAEHEIPGAIKKGMPVFEIATGTKIERREK